MSHTRARPLRRAGTALVLALCAAAPACRDLFVDPADAGAARVEILAVLAAGAAEGDGRAFDRADRVRVRLLRGEERVHEHIEPFRAGAQVQAGWDVRLVFAEERYRVALDVLIGEAPLFSGTQEVVLRRGRTSAIEVPLAPQAASVRASGSALRVDALGDTLRVRAAVVYATGDTLTGAAVVWSTPDAQVAQVSADGVVRLIGYGAARLIASARGLADTVVVRSLAVPAASVAAGEYHTCGAAEGGTPYCWGVNWSAQLGSGDYTPGGPRPVRAQGVDGVVQLSAGSGHSCAVDAAGAAYCWGVNDAGQIGDGQRRAEWPFGQHTSRVRGAVPWRMVDAGEGFTCGVTRDLDAFCWGRNDAGQLGGAGPSGSSVPAPVAGPRMRHVSAGSEHACGVDTAGGVHCWGSNTEGQLGDGTTRTSTTPVRVRGVAGAVRVEAARQHSCALTNEGALYCWGANDKGQLGVGDLRGRTEPARVAGAYIALATTNDHVCAVSADSELLCWGWNPSGQVGDGGVDHLNRSAPVRVALPGPVRTVAAGKFHSCAALVSGALHCWGTRGHGTLADDAVGFTTGATAAPGGLRFAAVAAGEDHACGILADARLACWGSNWTGQLGQGVVDGGTNRTEPTPLAGAARFRSLVAGDLHSCAISAEARTYCWGSNTHGQLGDGSTTPRGAPTPVAGAIAFASVATGRLHSCGLTPDGEAYCWGSNEFGQLGAGTGAGSSVPRRVAGGHRFVQLSAAGGHTCGIDVEGVGHCWGSNRGGQLGDGSVASRAVPAPIAGDLRLRAIVAAGNWDPAHANSCALTDTGEAFCWGRRAGCRLGIDDCALSAVTARPAPVAGGLRFASITAGSSATCALTAEGQAYCWGSHFWGELGDGSLRADARRPIPVLQGVRLAAISSRHWHSCAVTLAGELLCWGYRKAGVLADGRTAFVPRPAPAATALRF